MDKAKLIKKYTQHRRLNNVVAAAPRVGPEMGP